jgi:hypothetical protein
MLKSLDPRAEDSDDLPFSGAHSHRWGAWGLAAFAGIYPLLTGPHPLDNNLVKFYALAICGLTLMILLLAPGLQRLSFAHLPRPARLSVAIGVVLGGYAVVLGGIRLETLLILFLLPSLGWLLATPGEHPWLPRWVHRLLTALVILVVAACFFSTSQYTALIGHGYRRTGLVTLCACVVVFLAGVRYLHTREDATLIVRWLLIGSVPVGLIALLQFFDPGQWMASYFSTLVKDPRPMGTLGQTNWFGTYLLLLFPFAVHWSVRDRSWKWGGVAGLLYGCLLVAQTRGAWVAATVFLLAYGWHSRRQWRHLLRLAALFALFTVLLVPWNDYQILQRAGSIQDEAGRALEGRDDTGSGRFSFWRYAVEHVPARAVLGAGLDTLSDLGTEERQAPDSKAHSIYLEYAVTIGLTGLCCWIAFLWRCFSIAGPAGDSMIWRLMLCTYLVQGVFIHDTIQTWPLLWLLAAAAIATGRTNFAGRELGAAQRFGLS